MAATIYPTHEYVEETPFERVVRMLSNNMERPTRPINTLAQYAASTPSAFFLRPAGTDWTKRLRATDVPLPTTGED